MNLPKFFRIVPVLVLISMLGACSVKTGYNGSYGPTSKSSDTASQRAERIGDRECGRMPSYTNSGKRYTCDLETRRWVPSEYANKSREEKIFAVELERCIDRYKRNGYRGSAELSCGKEMELRYGNRNRSYDQYGNQENDFIAIYKTKFQLLGYAGCRAELLDIRGVPRAKSANQVLEFGYKNPRLKAFTSEGRSGEYRSRYHYFQAHEQTQFLVKLIFPNGRETTPQWTDFFQYDENTNLEEVTYIHAARDARNFDAEAIRSGCLLN